MLGDEREHLAGPAARERPLLDDGDPVRLLDRAQHRLDVDRAQRPQVDHLGRDALRGEQVGGGEAVVDALHRADERDVGALADDRWRARARSGSSPSTGPLIE